MLAHGCREVRFYLLVNAIIALWLAFGMGLYANWYTFCRNVEYLLFG